MKSYFKFPILFFVFAMLAITSCKDEDITAANRAKMVGDWKATSLSQRNCNDPADDISLSFGEDGACFELAPFVEACVVVTFTFKEDGTLTSTFTTTSPLGNETESSNGTWEVLDATRMTVCLPNDSGVQECSTGTYAVSNTELIYNGSDPDNGCDVTFTAEKQ